MPEHMGPEHESPVASSEPAGTSPPPTDAPGGPTVQPAASPPAAPAPVPQWKQFAAWCLTQCQVLAAKAWKLVCDVTRYYWGIRQPLWEYIAGFAPNLMAESVRMREVRLAPYESLRSAEFDGASWKVAIPGRCVVCGERTDIPPIDEDRAVDDAARAFLVPLATIAAGIVFALIIYNRWVLVVSIPLGFVLGYLMRARKPVHLRVARCEPHAGRTNIPQVLAWGNTLVLRFGHKLVRKAFLYGETVDAPVPHAEVPVPTAYEPAETAPLEKPPETIPLAESPHPDDATIRHSPPPAFRPEDQPRSPLVP